VAAAGRSFKADGIDAGTGAVLGGALDGIERALAAQLRPGDSVAVEDPVYPAHLDLLGALGLEVEAVAVDARGMLPDALARALRRGVRAVILSPRAQNPTGAALDRSRQAALQSALDERPETFVIEDDHAWLIAGVPYRTLTRNRERWFAVRSLSKAFGPDLRVAVAAGDPMTIARIKGRQRIGVGWVSRISQALARGLWSDAKVTAGIKAAARTYRERREALLQARGGTRRGSCQRTQLLDSGARRSGDAGCTAARRLFRSGRGAISHPRRAGSADHYRALDRSGRRRRGSDRRGRPASGPVDSLGITRRPSQPSADTKNESICGGSCRTTQ
jgi:DNA-binding transcriptional MocR family regulator